MVSLKDIASRCGVSVATVSKALNGQQDVSQETRERVRRTAEEMGYMANAAARTLKTHRSYNLGVLFVDARSSGLAHEYFSAVLDSIRVQAESRGYDITFINRNLGDRPTSYLQHCRYRGVDGVIIASVDFTDPMVVELVNSDLPIVTIDHVFNNRSAVVSDNITGMQSLTEYAIGMGHRKLAFLHGERTAVTEQRLIGFHRACSAAGITVPEEWIQESAYHDTANCYRLTRELLSRSERPDCIFFPDDFSYVGGMNAIRELGLRIPEDISVLGYDGIRLSQILSPRLTTWRQDTDALGRRAASRLVEMIEHPRTTIPDQLIVSGELLRGESVKDLTNR